LSHEGDRFTAFYLSNKAIWLDCFRLSLLLVFIVRG
jgi:hypothetical protein